MWHADQFPVGKHRPRALVAVVEHDIHASACEFSVELVGSGFYVGKAVGADRAQHHGKRGNRIGPDDAARVVVLLDGGGRQARDTDAVATHFHELRLAVFIEKSGVHGAGIFGSEVEHVADLYAAFNCQHALAIG